MPSRKGLDQALTWLRNKMAEKDTLDAINAEVCYNVIVDLREKRKVIGALYHQAHAQNVRAQRYRLEQMEKELAKAEETERLYKAAIAAMKKYSESNQKTVYTISNEDIPEEWKEKTV